MSTNHNPAFPSIGTLAEKADALENKLDEENDPHPSDTHAPAVAGEPSPSKQGVDDSTVLTTTTENEEEKPLQEIESLCMACGEQGITRLMLTSIPYFKEVIVSSFFCEHCGAQNNEIQSAGTIRDFGLVYTVKVLTGADLNRQLVKSSYATVTVPELELTIPPGKGQLTTIEGLLKN
ncbi:nucleolar zinc-finger protein, partial [Serendipita sp. 399]